MVNEDRAIGLLGSLLHAPRVRREVRRQVPLSALIPVGCGPDQVEDVLGPNACRDRVKVLMVP